VGVTVDFKSSSKFQSGQVWILWKDHLRISKMMPERFQKKIKGA